MNPQTARSVWKSIIRNHPFFQAGGMFGFDWQTFHVCYPNDCAILRAVLKSMLAPIGSESGKQPEIARQGTGGRS